MISDLDVHFEGGGGLYINPLTNSMDPVSTVSGLDLDCLSMLTVNQLTDKIMLT